MAIDDPDLMPTPALEDAFVLDIEPGPELAIGRLATGGVRSVRAVQRGSFAGSGIKGALVSGTETMLARRDGVTVIEASYILLMADGSPVRILGTGYVAEGEGFDGTRMTLTFEVHEGSPCAWLANRAFIAERPAGATALRIAQIV